MIESIGIIGAGTMGNGIAQVCAAAGLKVSDLGVSAESEGFRHLKLGQPQGRADAAHVIRTVT